MKSIFISASLAATLSLASCSDWTKPENMDFSHKPVQKSAGYVDAVKEYKKGGHKVTLTTVNGTSGTLTRQNQHLTSMADSVDVICVLGAAGLNPTIANEIAEVHEMGTRVVCVVDYLTIEDAWKAMQEDGAEPDPDGFAAYCTEQTDLQLSYCDKYGFDGIEISYMGNQQGIGTAGQTAFMDCVTEWREVHAGKMMFFRGYPQNLIDNSILQECSYLVLPCGTAVSDSQLDLVVRGRLAQGVPTDRVVIEVTIPDVMEPVQVGATPQRAAQWTLTENTRFTKTGLAVWNAQDDYFNTKTYKNIREAIGIMDVDADE